MIIAISTNGMSLDAVVEPRFGRCSCFIVIDPATMKYDVLNNPASTNGGGGGAGIAAAQMLARIGVETVLTGNYGPNAHRVLSANEIQVIAGVSGKIKDAIEEYKLGAFSFSEQATVADHFGAGGGSGWQEDRFWQ